MDDWHTRSCGDGRGRGGGGGGSPRRPLETLTVNVGFRYDVDSIFDDGNNVAPRLGITWSLDPKTVVRASWGVSYDRYRLGIAQAVPELGGFNGQTAVEFNYPRLAADAIVPLPGTVKFSGSVADLADETRHAELPWISIPTRHYQPRRLAVAPLRCERSRCRRSPGPTRHDGVLRSDPAVVPHGRFSIRSPAHATTGPAGRHLAPGRGLRHHPGTAALSLACRRSRWGRHRYPRPVASRLSGGYTLFPQAVEGPGAYAWAVGHRQAEQRQGCAPSGHAVRRPSHGPIREQSRRSLPPAHTATRATNASGHISRAGTTILVRPWTRPQPLPRWPSPGASGASSGATRTVLSS